jgi:hypothetical protein
MSLTLNTYYTNYSNENVNKVIQMYKSYFPNINFNRLNFNGRNINLNNNIVKKIKNLRDNKCIMKGNECKKIETGGVLNCDNGECYIKNIQNGQGDTINLYNDNLKELLFHTHPNAFGIWNKASPPSEFDLFNSLEFATKGISKINLIWDAYGIYIYYIYPEIINQIDGLNIQSYRDSLINILRWTKMGFGFYYNNQDFKSQYSCFSQYRNMLKKFGIYVDYKRYNKKMKFIIPN